MKKITKVLLTTAFGTATGIAGYAIGIKKARKEYEKRLDELNKRVDDIIAARSNTKDYGVKTEEEASEEVNSTPQEADNEPINTDDEYFYDDNDDIFGEDADKDVADCIKGCRFIPSDMVDEYTSESGGYNYNIESLDFYPDDERIFNVLIPSWDIEDWWDNFDCTAAFGEDIDAIMERFDNPIPGEPKNVIYYVNFDVGIVYRITQHLNSVPDYDYSNVQKECDGCGHIYI